MTTTDRKPGIWLAVVAITTFELFREGFYVIYEWLVFLAARYEVHSVLSLIESERWTWIVIPTSHLFARIIPTTLVAIFITRKYPGSVSGWGRWPLRSEVSIGAAIGFLLTGLLLVIVNTYHTQWYAGWTSIHFRQQYLESVLLGGFLLVLAAPLSEELVFRGIIFERLLTSFSPLLAAVLCSGAFALLHLGLAPTLVAVSFVDSLAYCYAYRRSGLWGALCAHGTSNGLKTLYFSVQAVG